MTQPVQIDQTQLIGFLLQKLQHIEMHVDTIARLQRYQMWQDLLTQRKEEENFNQFGFKIFSMNDQDGIIEKIFHILNRPDVNLTKSFIEFGSDNGIGNNSHYLLVKGWKGCWFDCRKDHIDFIHNKFFNYIKGKKLFAKCDFIDKNNINDYLVSACAELSSYKEDDLDLLVIDTDWNDYYLWQALDRIKPKVVCIEYNAHIPPPNEIVVPYNNQPIQLWDGSNCFGASFSALEKLGKEKGYYLLTCSLAGTDMFFIREEYWNLFYDWINKKQPKDLYEPARFNLEFTLGHTLMTPGTWEI